MTARELAWAGVPYTALGCKDQPEPGSYVLLRAAVVKTRRDDCHTWAVDLKPIADVNDHVYVYQIPSRERASSK